MTECPDSEMAYSDEVFYLTGIYMSIIFLLGVFLNFGVIIVFSRIEIKRRNILNALIISISISNLLQSIVSYPINAAAAFHSQWIFGDSVCVIDGFLVLWMALSSINHLAVFSIER